MVLRCYHSTPFVGYTKSMIIFVGAHAHNYAMGYKRSLPWPLMQRDKDHLHNLANGKHIVMGERTYHDYKDIRAAFETDDVTVISRSVDSLPDATVVHSIQPIIDQAGGEDLWVIGGGNVFTQLLPYANKMYLTEIDGEFEADTFFPEYEKNEWIVDAENFPADDQNPYPYAFLTLTRRS